MLPSPDQGGEESPSKHSTAPPSRLHNFNIKSRDAQRILRRNLHARNHIPTDEIVRPSNLRDRRSEDKEGKGDGEISVPSQQEVTAIKENKERRKFCVSLSKEEIEEDVYAMKGTRPARRPKKRPRAVQRQIDTLSPGGYLDEINLETYQRKTTKQHGLICYNQEYGLVLGLNLWDRTEILHRFVEPNQHFASKLRCRYQHDRFFD